MSERLRVSDLRGEDRILEIEEAGQVVAYTVPGGTSVELIAFMMSLEARMEGEDNEVIAATSDATDLIWEQIKIKSPDAPRPKLTIEEAMGAMAFMAGGSSATEVVAEALTTRDEDGNPIEPKKTAEELVDGDPLENGASQSPSKKSSQKRSSGSGSGTSGRQTGRRRPRSATSAAS